MTRNGLESLFLTIEDMTIIGLKHPFQSQDKVFEIGLLYLLTSVGKTPQVYGKGSRHKESLS